MTEQPIPLRAHMRAVHEDPFSRLVLQVIATLRTRRAYQVSTRKYRARRGRK